MLESLHVQNFAIVSDLTLNFGEGLNIFSGETGAGKSLVLDALSFVLGARGDTSVIKDDATKMSVTACFTSDMLPDFVLKENGITSSNFLLKRELDNKGKGKAYINQTPVTVACLAKIGKYLVDFHGQHEHQSLLHNSVHLSLLDQFAKHTDLCKSVQMAYEKVQSIQNQIQAINLSEQEKERMLDMYTYQLNEIDNLHPSKEEDEQLTQTLPTLKNAGKLSELSSESYNELYAKEESATATLAKALKSLEVMSRYDEKTEAWTQEIKNILSALEEISANIYDYNHRINLDPSELDNLLDRHEKLKRLKAKYGPTIEDVLNCQKELNDKILNLKNATERQDTLEHDLKVAKEKLLKLSYELHDSRMVAAKKLGTCITEQIAPLGFNQINFSVSVEMDEENITSTGADQVEFLFSPNPGQSLRPLKNIASGGEMSRVMLGLKTTLASSVPIMVFDEIDAGIGGETANLVGKKLQQVANGKQVLCVTHLAQVAAGADHHFKVQKDVENQQTLVTIQELIKDDIPLEIARMLGGNTSKDSVAYKHALELIKEAHCN